jgi:hypothetical protein
MVGCCEDKMSFAHLRPYFRDRIRTVGGLNEWKVGLNTDNIPSSILDGSFHIDISGFNQIKQNQDCLDASGEVIIKLFAKGAKDPQKAVDWVIAKGQAVLEESLKATNRLTQPSIKNVTLKSFTPAPYSPSDDNDVELRMVFEVHLVLTIPRGV